jgi:hypothetical protein
MPIDTHRIWVTPGLFPLFNFDTKLISAFDLLGIPFEPM